jgi:diguanylate cyclase (GGDEF)-like protein
MNDQRDRHDSADLRDAPCADARQFAWLMALSSSGGAAVVALSLWSAVPKSLLAPWLAAAAAVAWAQWRYGRRAPSAADRAEHPCARARQWIAVNALGAGMFWGASAAILVRAAPGADASLLALIAPAAAALWLPLFALAPASSLLFAVPAMLPMAFGSLPPATSPQTSMGSLFALFSFAALYVAARATHRLFTADLRTRRDLYHQATHDALVGLANRAEFERRARLVESAGAAQHAIVCLDLDHFKEVNDAAGHAIGDELLREIGQILRQSIRNGDTAARLGGDEFAVLMRDCGQQDALRLAAMLLERIAGFTLTSTAGSHRVTASLGVAFGGGATLSAKRLLEAADHACYTAKRSGRNRVAVATATDAPTRRAHNDECYGLVSRLSS